MSTWRKCLSCGQVKEKGPNFSVEEWKCNSCVTGIVSSPSASTTATATYSSPSSYTKESSPVRVGSFSGSSLTRKGSMSGKPDDVEQYRKLFWNIDEDKSGLISKKELRERMLKMLGTFTWEDTNNDGYINFDEFVKIMDGLQPSARYSAVEWSRQCLASDGLLKSKSQMRRLQSMRGSPSSTSPAKKSSEEDRAAWKKLFDHIDSDRTGSIERMELEEKMTKMLGKFEWQDQDNSGAMDFEEFVTTMDKMNPSTRYSALSWAKQCLQ